MTGRIPQEFIDDVVARADIVDVIEERVALKKAGREFKACCPFHEEKTPSFTVSREKQFYHCFGCGAHGTVIGFLMDYAHMEFPEAVETLAERLGMAVPREAGAGLEDSGLREIYETLERAAEWYRQQLRHHPGAARAVDYLRGRGLDGRIAAEFGIGFAPPGWDNLVRALGASAPGASSPGRRELVRAGLAAERDGGECYDRLRNRVVFPIRDRRGRTIAFGGRVLDDTDTPKYLNSPESPAFHKGRELYGLFEARRAVRKLERLVVVEGYMDVVALAQHGIGWAVATLGTAATLEHVERLFRTVRDVIFCFDGDEAGRRAAWRALENTLPAMRDGRQALFVFLPEGEDPDSVVRSAGAAGFERLVDAALPLSDLLLRDLGERAGEPTVEGRARLAELARPLLASVPPGTYRRLLAARIAEVCGAPVDEPAANPEATRRAPREKARHTALRTEELGRRMVRLVLHHPSLASEITTTDALAGSESPGLHLLRELIELARERAGLTTAGILERYRGHQFEGGLRKLATSERVELSDTLRQEFSDGFAALAAGIALERTAARRAELDAAARCRPLSEEEKAEYRRLVAGRGSSRSGKE